jgi:hypothetical protein
MKRPPLYVILLAACLLFRAADLAHAGWSDRRDAMDRDAAMSGRSGTVGLTLNRDLWAEAFYRESMQRALRDAGHYGCGCSPDRRGGQAGAAGF